MARGPSSFSRDWNQPCATQQQIATRSTGTGWAKCDTCRVGSMYVPFGNRCNGHLAHRVHLSARPSQWQHLRQKKLGGRLGDFNAQTSSTHHLSGSGIDWRRPRCTRRRCGHLTETSSPISSLEHSGCILIISHQNAISGLEMNKRWTRRHFLLIRLPPPAEASRIVTLSRSSFCSEKMAKALMSCSLLVSQIKRLTKTAFTTWPSDLLAGGNISPTPSNYTVPLSATPSAVDQVKKRKIQFLSPYLGP